MNLIDGHLLAQQHRAETKWLMEEASLRLVLAVILIGQHPPSQLYVQNKKRACEEVGIELLLCHLPENSNQQSIENLIKEWNRDDRIHGIFIQLPLPPNLNKDLLISCIDPRKDVDGLHPYNVGMLWSGTPRIIPCTPLGCLQLIQTIHPSLKGKRVGVIGRSNLVGKPMAALLLLEDATVTVAHSHSQNIDQICKESEILVVAVGKPHFIKHVRKGATVIDVGINKTIVGVTGDVDPQVEAGFRTPVPRGVGPMTIANLLRNTYLCAKKSVKI